MFTPDPNYNGPASFDYAVTDPEGNTDIGRVTFNVDEIADGPPVATNDTVVPWVKTAPSRERMTAWLHIPM